MCEPIAHQQFTAFRGHHLLVVGEHSKLRSYIPDNQKEHIPTPTPSPTLTSDQNEAKVLEQIYDKSAL